MLLDHYKDSISDGKPTVFPPKISITHQINCIPRDLFLSKVAYKMTSQQNEEIAKQVQELLDNVLIRKTINPCVAPTILEPKKGDT